MKILHQGVKQQYETGSRTKTLWLQGDSDLAGTGGEGLPAALRWMSPSSRYLQGASNMTTCPALGQAGRETASPQLSHLRTA